jgi:glucan phosphoethanolaminetransferase (alkaline phosphatase superfamily)
MSFWWYRRDKSGKRYLWQIDYDPMIVLVVIGLIVAIIGPSLLRNPSIIIFFPFFLLIAGLACLVISKISLYKKRIWFSFGSGLMSKGYANLYKVAYVLIGVGVLLMLLLFNALRRAQQRDSADHL